MNLAKWLDRKLEDFVYRLEDLGASIYEWFTEDWWFIPIIAVAILIGVVWLLTGGVDHFKR